MPWSIWVNHPTPLRPISPKPCIGHLQISVLMPLPPGSFHFLLETELGALLMQHLLHFTVMADLPTGLPHYVMMWAWPSNLAQARSLVRNPKKCFICMIFKQVRKLCFYSFKYAYVIHFIEDIFVIVKLHNCGNVPEISFPNLLLSVNFEKQFLIQPLLQSYLAF